jgi:VWFA-related protein
MNLRIAPVGAALALALASAVPSFCQQSPPEITTNEAPITFSSRVNLVTAPVVVRDRDGKAIGTLKQEDFQVLDKGKPQVITKFSIQKSGQAADGAGSAVSNALPENSQAATPAQPVMAQSYLAYLVDDVHLKPGDLLQTRQAMNRHLDEALDASSRAAIFTTSGQMLSDFTGDREQLHRAINSVQPWSRGPSLDDCPPISYYQADLLTNKFNYFSGLTGVQIASLYFGAGDKALKDLLTQARACSGLAINDPPPPPPPPIPPPPPPPEPLVDFVSAAIRQAMQYGDRETLLGLHALKEAVGKLSVMPGSRNLVLVSPGFLLTLDHRTEESDVFDRAIRANVTINTIDMRGLFTVVPGGGASQSGYADDAESALRTADVLAELADGTGGTFFHNDNDLKRGLNLLAARPEYVYMLGFSPEGLKFDGTYHALRVTIKNSAGLTIQARRGYWAPKHALDAAEAAKQELQETFFSHEDIPGLPLDLQTSFFKSGDEKFQLSVTARLDIKTLRFKKADGRNDDTLTVVAGLFDSNGKNIVATQKTLGLRLRDESLASLLNAGIRMKENFSVPPGRYTVRVVVTDSEGQTVTARNGNVQIP